MSTNFWKPLSSLTWPDIESLASGDVTESPSLDFKGFGPAPREKSGWPSMEGLSALICAMSNTTRGRIVLGAESDAQDHRLTGFHGIPQDRKKAAVSRIHEAAARVQPPASVETAWVDVPNRDECILVVEVVADRLGPRQFDGRYLMRVDSSDRAMPHSVVEAAILANNAEGRSPWPEFVNPLETGDILSGTSSSKWQFGAWLHAPKPMPHLLDPGEDSGLDKLKMGFSAEQLFGIRYGVNTAGFDEPDRRKLRVQYTGAAWEIVGAASFSDVENVPMRLLGDHLERSIRRLARLMKAIGYEQNVFIKVILKSPNGTLKLEWDDGHIQPAVWTNEECLSDVLIGDLIDPSSKVVSDLRRRFMNLARLRAEVHGPLHLW